ELHQALPLKLPGNRLQELLEGNTNGDLEKNRTGQRVHHYCPREVASLGDGRESETVPDSPGPKRVHPLPGGNQHRVLPHLRGLCLRFGARGGGHCDPRWVLCCTQLPTASPQSCRSPLHLSQGLKGAARPPGEGEGDDPGGED
ncbi:hypothetical protein J4Q44_G00113280, partial [Coregonus suidteri]